MKKKTIKSVIAILLLFSSCSYEMHLKRVSKRIAKAESNFDLESVSDAYAVYKTRKEFIFSVKQSMTEDTLSFSLILQIIPNKKSKSAYVKYIYEYEDADIEKLNYSDDCKGSTSNMCFSEITSINELKGWALIHPPRSKSLEILELAPFPEFINYRKKWKSTLTIPKGSWGEWENTSFNWVYERDSVEYVGDSVLNKAYIHSSSTSKFGVNTNNFIFQKDSGFVEMNYNIENQGTVHIKLIQINDSYL